MPEQPKQAEQEVLLTNQTNKSQKNNCKKLTVAKAQRKCYVMFCHLSYHLKLFFLRLFSLVLFSQKSRVFQWNVMFFVYGLTSETV